MITKIHIDNYKCFANFNLTLNRLTLLCGTNGAGKSALFEVLWKLRTLLCRKGEAGELFGWNTRTRWDKRPEQRFELEIEEPGIGTYLYSAVIQHLNETKNRLSEERLSLNAKPLFSFIEGEVMLYRDDHSEGPTYHADWSSSALSGLGERHDNTHHQKFRKLIDRFLFLSPNPIMMSAIAPKESSELEPHGENFASWLRWQLSADPDVYGRAMENLQNILPGLTKIYLEGESIRQLRVEFGRNNTYSFDELSDGQRQLIALYSVINMDDTDLTLCLDEPDNYVTLPEVQPLLVNVEDACDDRLRQVLIASHHPEQINLLASNSVWLWRNGPDSPTRIGSIEEIRNLDTDLTLAELFARGWMPWDSK